MNHGEGTRCAVRAAAKPELLASDALVEHLKDVGRQVERAAEQARNLVASRHKIPEGYESDLAPYGAVLYDGWCGEPIAWGFEIRHRLGEERFNALAQHGQLECIDGFSVNTRWAVITKWLTPDEARAKYGQITDLALGPRGGFKSVTYGDKKFLSKKLCPP